MKIIISRKGLDSSNGGASPIFCDDDGRMVSVPIPADNSCIKYSDIHWQSEVGDNNLGNVVKQLSHSSIKSIDKSVKSDGLTHLDPDLRWDALERQLGLEATIWTSRCCSSPSAETGRWQR